MDAFKETVRAYTPGLQGPEARAKRGPRQCFFATIRFSAFMAFRVDRCLLVDDYGFCDQIVKLLQNHCNRTIAEIGSLDVTFTL